MASHDEKASSAAGAGVQALIERLKSEGVEAGQSEAEAILKKAQADAERLVQNAEAKAQAILEKAHKEAAEERSATLDGLKIAARDMVLSLRNELDRSIQTEASRLIGVTLSEDDFLQKLILSIAAKAKEDAGITNADKLDIVLPERAVTFDELKQAPEKAEAGTLTHFVVALAGDVLRDGVTFSTAPGLTGIRIKLTDKDVSIDITEEAVAELLKTHLQPRLRAIMEGVLR
ncbi:V/A-type H+-transporting ATPase subunit E [Roseibium hamelinense]|uniref:V-type ATP synthase subunit E n=1 Tax=Roseibium hamelinense TaxID=150831 RepID=A0A562SX95_9HYPH|nr:V-type ATP synthase subunit E family protein [Roseibium hamelinense]MTI44880.1 hypothetical protein [Roseibium hamelinense]TWI85925.1 V/A-type H+-transporting ATPase subunit E [Roseibium hamelinense]